MYIRSANLDDIPSVVDIHVKGFEGFFLTLLGRDFLAELYRAFASRQNGILRVLCDDNGTVIGFAGGTIKPDRFYQQLKIEKAFVFLFKSLPGLVRNPVLVVKKLWYAFFYKGEKPVHIYDVALLSSIAVLPEMAGKSLGTMLLIDYESQVKSLGVKSLYLTTDKFDNSNVIAFYSRNGYEVESEFLQADGRKMLRLIKFL